MKRLYKKSLYKIFVSLFIIFYSFLPQTIVIGQVLEEYSQENAAPTEEVITPEESLSQEEVVLPEEIPPVVEEPLVEEISIEEPVIEVPIVEEPVIVDPVVQPEEVIKEVLPYPATWVLNGDSATTYDVVKLGETYIAPQNSRVRIIFTKLPENPTKLTIEEITLTQEEIEATGAVSDKAYDIKTDLVDGTFEYDLTLPSTQEDTKVVYAEHREDIFTDLKEVTNTIVNDGDTLKIEDLEHFTLFIPSGGVVLSVSGSFNGVTQVTVEPGETIEVDITVQRSGSSSDNDWESTSWSINGGSTWACVNTRDNTIGQGTNTESFNITAPATTGTYSVSFRAHRDGSCGNTGVSNTFTLTDGIIVQNVGSANVCNNPSDSYSLSSSGGIWTSVNNGSNVNGQNTEEVKWGNSVGYGQSGLRFDSVGTQTFNENTKFLLGTLTHKNYPINNAADGATLQIKLSFSEPAIGDKTFSYYFGIEETPNSGNCPSWHQSSTPCDDKITFPNSYGSEVITINDIQYTLVIDGFVNSYTCGSVGSVLNYFITEEQKNNSAYLVGHLSSQLIPAPAISIVKKTNNIDVASEENAPELNVGDEVTWQYIVQNTGNVDLSNISVVDNIIGTINCPASSLPASSNPSERVMTCTATGTVIAGQYENTATVKGTPPNNIEVSAEDTSWYFGVLKKGHIIVDKVTNPSGDEQSFNFTTRGTGYKGFSLTDSSTPNDQELVAGTYTVSEGSIQGWDSVSSCTSSINDTESADNLELDPGETIKCIFTNTKLSINVEKTANPTSVPETGGDVEFTIKVKNTSAVAVNLTSLNDDKFGDLNNEGTCVVPQTISAGDSYECKFTKNISGEAGTQHKNIVTATASGVTDTDDATVDFTDVRPLVTMEKSVTPSIHIEPGGIFTYTLKITNNSEEDVKITTLTDTNTLSSECLALIGVTITPGASKTCSYTVEHTTAGTYDNTAYVLVTDNDGSTASDDDSKTVKVIGARITFKDLTATNDINDPHIFTVKVEQNKGGGWIVYSGGLVSFSLVNNTAGASFVGGVDNCTTDVNGECDIQINSSSPGTVEVHAETTVDVLEQSINRQTDGTLGSSINATKTYEAGKIIIKKETLPKGSTQEFEFNPSWSDSNFKLKDGGTEDSGWLAVGTYGVSEIVPDGWDLTSVICDDKSSVDSIVLNANNIITCEFTNTQRGSISGVKQEVNEDQSLVGVLSGWVIELWKFIDDTFINTGTTATTNSLGEFTFTNLVPGVYRLVEQLKDGWTQIFSPADLTVDPGVNLEDNDFGNFANVSISACKESDLDGLLETTNDRTPIDQWSVSLIKNGDVIDTQLTDTDGSDGCYYWTNLEPGNYSVSEETRTDWKNLTETTHNFGTVQSGQNYFFKFINFELGKITACKYEDVNGNGSKDIEDFALSNIDMKLYKYIDEDWNYEETLATLDDGCVMFAGLEAGQYRVEEDYNDPDLNGYYPSNDIEYQDFTITSGSEKTAIFINSKYRTIAGQKFEDINGNGIKDVGEPGLGGWTIYLDSNNNGTFDASEQSTVTLSTEGNEGKYEFKDLVSDSYRVREVLKEGWGQTMPSSGYYDVDLHDVYTGINKDFGNFANASIRACKTDTNNLPIAGWPMSLDYVDAVIGDGDETGENGCVDFLVAPGVYDLSEWEREGWSSIGETTIRKTIVSGESFTHTFVNFENVEIDVCKETTEGEPVEGWEVTLEMDDWSDTQETDVLGCYTWEVTEPGTYTASEDIQTGWTAQGLTTHDFVVTSGLEPLSHTFVNFEDSTVEWCKKDTDGNLIPGWILGISGINSYDTFAASGPSETGCETFEIKYPGRYTVYEDMESGWTPQGPTSYTFTAQSGDPDREYTFVNFEYAQINVTKNVLDPDGLEIVDTHNFTVQLDGLDNKTISETQSVSYTITNPGTYTISEIDDPNYDELGCFLPGNVLATDFEIQSGQTYNVECLNRQIPASLTLVKHLTKDDGGDESAEDFNVYINDELSSWGTHSVNPGQYTPSEDIYPGYEAGEWHCVDNSRPKEEMAVSIPVVLESNQSVTCSITNDDIAPTITLIKDVNIRYGGNAGVNDFGLSIGGTFVSSEEELDVIANTPISIDELGLSGYEWVSITGDEKCPTSLGGTVVLDEGEDIECTITNQDMPATVIVYKDVIDWNENDVYSDQMFEVILEGEFLTSQNIRDSETESIIATFGLLSAGVYTPMEINIPNGYISKGCSSLRPVDDDSDEISLMIYPYYVGNGETLTFICENQIIQPELEITKLNDRGLSGIYVGDIVTYTIIVRAPNDDMPGTYYLKDVTVIDISPKGFEYVSGSWTGTILEPEYNGVPAEWYLGNMKEGDEVTLTYRAKVSLLQDAGTYRDIVYTYGTSLLPGEDGDILGLGVYSGDTSTNLVKTNFVGSEVLVIEDPELEEGEVLGASIELPRTGADTYITLGALISMILGFIILVFNPKKKIKTLFLTTVLLLGVFTLVKPTEIFAVTNVEVQIEKPVSPTKEDTFKIGFVTLDLQGRGIKVQCFVNNMAFGSEYSTNSGNCDVTPTIITSSGTYNFYVVATPEGGTPVQSETVSVVVNLEKPLPVTNYVKTEGTCTYTLTFKTANDGRTSKVEIFRSSKQPFTANASTLILTKIVAPNTDVSYTDSSITDCTKEYFYAIRSIDDYNNVSSLVTDDIVTIVRTPAPVNPTPTPVDVTEEEGEVAGEETVTPKPEEEGKGEVKGEEDIDTENGEEGDEKNDENTLKSIWSNYKYFIIAALVVALGSGVYTYVRRKR